MNSSKLDLTKFESLVMSNDVLKGGFSSALTLTGGASSVENITNASISCGITNWNCPCSNSLAGCGKEQIH